MPTFATPGPISAVLEIGAGSIRLSAAERDDTVVEVRPADPGDKSGVRAAEQTRVEFAGGRLHVKSPKSRALFGWSGLVDLTVHLPAGSRVNAHATTDIRADGPLGECVLSTAAGAILVEETGKARLNTSSGDILLERAAGHADLITHNGEIRARELAASAVVKNSNGDIVLGSVSGDLRVSTASGDITIDTALSGLTAKTAHGSIRVGRIVSGSVWLETGSGDLAVGLSEGSAAWLDVSSGYGEVEVPPPATSPPSEEARTVRLRARTGHGRITVHRT